MFTWACGTTIVWQTNYDDFYACFFYYFTINSWLLVISQLNGINMRFLSFVFGSMFIDIIEIFQFETYIQHFASKRKWNHNRILSLLWCAIIRVQRDDGERVKIKNNNILSRCYSSENRFHSSSQEIDWLLSNHKSILKSKATNAQDSWAGYLFTLISIISINAICWNDFWIRTRRWNDSMKFSSILLTKSHTVYSRNWFKYDFLCG